MVAVSVAGGYRCAIIEMDMPPSPPPHRKDVSTPTKHTTPKQWTKRKPKTPKQNAPAAAPSAPPVQLMKRPLTPPDATPAFVQPLLSMRPPTASLYQQHAPRTFTQAYGAPPQQTNTHKAPPPSKKEDPLYTVHTLPFVSGKAFRLNSGHEVMLTVSRRFDFLHVDVRRLSDKCETSALLLNDNTNTVPVGAIEEAISNLSRLRCDSPKQAISEASVGYLHSHHIQPLRTPHEHFPDMIWYCTQCDFHMRSCTHAKNHLEQKTHFDEEKRQAERKALVDSLPKPCTTHKQAIETMVEMEIAEWHGSPARDQRLASINHLMDAVRRVLMSEYEDDAVVCLMGSWSYGVDEEWSDVNVYVDVPSVDIAMASDALAFLKHSILADSTLHHGPLAGMCDDVACVVMRPPQLVLNGAVRVRLHWCPSNALCLSEYMAVYAQLRPTQFPPLARLVRRWAKRCGLDVQEKGQPGMPPYGFDLMVVYYLQQKHDLPVLHDSELYGGEVPENADFLEKANCYQKHVDILLQQTIDGERPDVHWSTLLIGFFKLYVHGQSNYVVQVKSRDPVPKTTTKWNNKSMQLEDPFRPDNVAHFNKPFYSHLLNCILASFIELSVPRTRDGPLMRVGLYQTADESPTKKKADEAKARKEEKKARRSAVVADREKEQDKGEKANGLDHLPTLTRPSVAASLDSVATVTASLSALTVLAKGEEEEVGAKEARLLSRLRFDGLPIREMTEGDWEMDDVGVYSRRTMMRMQRVHPGEMDEEMWRCVDDMGIATRVLGDRNREWEEREARVREEHLLEAATAASVSTRFDDTFDTLDTAEKEESEDESAGKEQQGQFVLPAANSTPLEKGQERVCYEDFFIQFDAADASKVREHASHLNPHDFDVRWDVAERFTIGYRADVHCTTCDSCEHLADGCPQLRAPPVKECGRVPTQDEMAALTTIVHVLYGSVRLHPQIRETVLMMVEKLREAFSSQMGRHCRVNAFGSMMNGFGTHSSDVDLCFRFECDSPPKDCMPADVIHRLKKILFKLPNVRNVMPILGAKVPIIKFDVETHNRQRFEADISYYNVLALYNTEMLAAYCNWDDRVAPLGLFLKQWAKSSEIGDASKGSLSSYTYIILLIHYLQVERVVPCLQEDFGTMPSRKVDGWETAYFTDIVPGWSENQKSVGELLVGFFDYYARFDWEESVVCVRRRRVLWKTEKGWNRPMCVEDPFDLNHNLSSGLSPKMFIYVLRSIHCSREKLLLGEWLPAKFLPQLVRPSPSLAREALSTMRLSDSPPIDRQCRICHHIGHFADSCPNKRGGKRGGGGGVGNAPGRAGMAAQSPQWGHWTQSNAARGGATRGGAGARMAAQQHGFNSRMGGRF